VTPTWRRTNGQWWLWYGNTVIMKLVRENGTWTLLQRRPATLTESEAEALRYWALDNVVNSGQAEVMQEGLDV